jgi:glucokinase
VKTTNLPWVVDADALAERFGLARVSLVNDLEAVAWGIDLLEPSDVVELNDRSGKGIGNRAVIAAGTGLGQAGVHWDGRRHRPFACEGGHTSFAPTTPEQWELLRFLERDHDHVSWERVVSGPGLVSIHDFILRRSAASAPDWLDERMRRSGAAPAIAEAGLSGASDSCTEALRLFVGLYGAEAGNLALKIMATGGVYLAGGIAPAIEAALRRGEFMAGFLAKGRMRPLLETMPVRIVMDESTGLKGAAACVRQAQDPAR